MCEPSGDQTGPAPLRLSIETSGMGLYHVSPLISAGTVEDITRIWLVPCRNRPESGFSIAMAMSLPSGDQLASPGPRSGLVSMVTAPLARSTTATLAELNGPPEALKATRVPSGEKAGCIGGVGIWVSWRSLPVFML